MATYRLIYFNLKGRAEIIRYIFAQAGVDYEDRRVTREQFVKMKPDLPSGSLPMLEENGKMLAESGSIMRYLGEKLGLGGSNEWDNAQIHSLNCVIDDFMATAVPALFEINPEKKAAAEKDLFVTHLPKYFEILEKRIVANNSPDGWAYGNKITYIDLRISMILDELALMVPDLAIKFPALCKLNEAVNAQPNIAAWIKKRPDTLD